jgi:hypothetical protein
VSRTIPSTELGPVVPVPFDVRDRLRQLGPAAVDRVEQLMWNQRNPNVALKAAEMVLDRVVPKETKHTESRMIRVVLEKSEEVAAKKVLEEADVIDIEAEVT